MGVLSCEMILATTIISSSFISSDGKKASFAVISFRSRTFTRPLKLTLLVLLWFYKWLFWLFFCFLIIILQQSNSFFKKNMRGTSNIIILRCKQNLQVWFCLQVIIFFFFFPDRLKFQWCKSLFHFCFCPLKIIAMQKAMW